MRDIKIYILTHKQFNYEKNDLYEPLLNGSALLNQDFGYTRDDTGDNISKLNPYYSELTGEYWVWKNSTADIIGFCHYRRYFVKNIFMKKIEKKDISNWLNEYDIIIPQRRYKNYTNIEEIKLASQEMDTCEKVEDYTLLRKIIEEKTPEYLDCYDEFLNDYAISYFNMFICRKQLADKYFEWLFDILEEFKNRNDFSNYNKENMRVLGYLSERLLNVYIIYHKLNIKEIPILHTDSKVPLITMLEQKSPLLQKILNLLLKK